jgi:2-dehydro-3-deoxygluconokinase
MAAGHVVTIGETMASLRAGGSLRLGGDLRLSIAGAESTVAIGLVRLGCDARWVGVVGDDQLGALILRTLRAEGVGVAGVRIDSTAPTGLMFVEPLVGDVMRVSYRRLGSAGSRLGPADVDAALATSPAWLHVSGITAALSPTANAAAHRAVAQARQSGCRTCFDVNYRAALWSRPTAAQTLSPLAAASDLVLASQEELALVSPLGGDAKEEETAAALLEAGVGEVVVTRGADGASAYSAAGVIDHPAARVTVVDTVGAGDAFAAGYLSAFLDGADPPGRLERAVRTAAFAVGCRGDWEGLPSQDELALLDAAPGATLR